jgi:hypothetical protein
MDELCNSYLAKYGFVAGGALPNRGRSDGKVELPLFFGHVEPTSIESRA